MSKPGGAGTSVNQARPGTRSANARLANPVATRPSAVLLDFHNTLAIVGPIDAWIDDASALVEGGLDSRTMSIERIRNVWGDAKKLFPTLDWDLDPAAHRYAFVSTLIRDSALDAVILSYEVGYVKPDPRVFQLAADSLGVHPTHCLMIGDSTHDDVGGAVLGMQCLIARPDQTRRAFALACPS